MARPGLNRTKADCPSPGCGPRCDVATESVYRGRVPELVYPPVVVAARIGFKLLGLRFDVVGSEHIPTTGGAVLASNHNAYPDFIFDGLAAQPSHRLVRFMAKKSVFAHPVAGPLMRGMRHIPVDRSAGAAAYEHAVAALCNGELVGVFPEATIGRSFLIKDLKSGAVRMAAEAQVPLIPMVTFGGQRIWTKGRRPSMGRGVTIAITVGEPMHPLPADDPDIATAELRDRLTSLLDETISRYPKPSDADADLWWLPAKYGGSAPEPTVVKHQDEVDAAGGEAAYEARQAGPVA